jgi:hypothetical protein
MKTAREEATMTSRPTRRSFLRTVGTGSAALGLGEWAALAPLSRATAEEATVTPDLVRFSTDIEPIVRLIEETPREQCVAEMLEQIRRGLPYRNFLAALYLAAIRAAKWHGGIHGYDHNAYVVHSAHQLALDLPASEQLLPAFYALDNFKGMQRVYPNRPGTPALTGTLPATEKATAELHAAMREWEPERAERAIVAMVRSQATATVLEPLWHYAGRDWGFIGHMAILVANSARLLDTIGWRHAEHVLRYVVAALAGWGKAHAEDADVQPYWANVSRVQKAIGQLPGNWAEDKGDEGVTREFLVSIRMGNPAATCDLAVQQLLGGKTKAGAIWDAIHLAAGEMMLGARFASEKTQRNGDALHANTAANALHYAFRSSTASETRLLLSLQALAWMHLYRHLIQKKNLLDEALDISTLTGAELPKTSQAAIDEILATRSAQPYHAARLAFSLAQKHDGDDELIREALRLLPVKASGDPHDIKFPVAISEDLDLVRPVWRPHMLAVAVFSFWGSDRPDNPVMQRVRDSIQKL